jgi:hypothetical protein
LLTDSAEAALAPSFADLPDSALHHFERYWPAMMPASAGRDQCAADGPHSGVSTSVTGRGYVNFGQLKGGYLQRVGQSHDRGAAVQRALSEFNAGKLRLAHPGQPSDHHQRLTPAAANQAHPGKSK